MRHFNTHTLWIQQAVRCRRVDLRKIDGKVNPADLLTKHSLSRARMAMLVELFGCRFLKGRAASAPLMRRGGTTKTTMASAGKDLGAVTSGDVDDLGSVPGGDDECNEELPDPIMPHVLYSKDRLEELHPRFPAPADDKLDDLQDDAQDATTFTKDCSKVPIGWTDIAPRDRLSEFFHSSRFNFLAFTLFFLLRRFICNRFQFLTFGQKPKSSIESCPFLD